MRDFHVIQAIDDARRHGHTYDSVHEMLRESGIRDPDAVLQHYAASVLPDGRRRGQVNYGDPAEPRHHG